MALLMQSIKRLPAGQRWSLIAFSGMAALPVVLIFGVQITNAIQKTDTAVASPSSSRDFAQLEAIATPESLADPLAKAAARLFVAHDELTNERQAVLTLDVPLDDMRVGKTLTAKALTKKIEAAQAAIGAVAEAECGRLKQRLASQCRVISAQGRLAGPSTFQYQFELAFTQKDARGDLPENGPVVFSARQIVAGTPETRARTGIAKADTLRSKLYADLAAQCRLIRKTNGTCSITALSIASQQIPDLPMVQINASATFAALGRLTIPSVGS